MKVTVKVGDVAKTTADLIVLDLFEGTKRPGGATGSIDKASRGLLSAYLKDGDFKGKLNEKLLFRPTRGIKAKRVLVVGLGKKEEFCLDYARQAAGTAAQVARSLGLTRMASIVHGAGAEDISTGEAAQATVEGTCLGGYRFSHYKSGKENSGKPITQLTIIERDSAKAGEIRKGARQGSALSECVVSYRLGMEGQGSKAFVTVLDSLGVAMKEPEAYGVALADLNGIAPLFDAMLGAQQRGDYLFLADLLQYELGPALLGPIET